MVKVMAILLHELRIYMIGKLLHDAKSCRSLGRDAVLSIETKQRNQGGSWDPDVRCRKTWIR